MCLSISRIPAPCLAVLVLSPGCRTTSEAFVSDLAGDWTATEGKWTSRPADGQPETKCFPEEDANTSGEKHVMVSFLEDGSLDWTKMYMAPCCFGAHGLRVKGDRFPVKGGDGVLTGYVEVSDAGYTPVSTRVVLKFFGEARQIAETISFYATIRRDGTVGYRQVKSGADQSIEVTATLERITPANSE